MNVNSGYVGYSMSKRAVEAYEQGEKPKSKWTKAAMLSEIVAYCDEFDMEISDEAWVYLRKLTKAELFNRFFYKTSWHHTSKYFNQTDFYGLDEEELVEFVEKPTARVYYIGYSLGSHKAKGSKTFPTMAMAEKHLASSGFKEGTYAWRRGGFYASVESEKVEL